MFTAFFQVPSPVRSVTVVVVVILVVVTIAEDDVVVVVILDICCSQFCFLDSWVFVTWSSQLYPRGNPNHHDIDLSMYLSIFCLFVLDKTTRFYHINRRIQW